MTLHLFACFGSKRSHADAISSSRTTKGADGTAKANAINQSSIPGQEQPCMDNSSGWTLTTAETSINAESFLQEYQEEWTDLLSVLDIEGRVKSLNDRCKRWYFGEDDILDRTGANFLEHLRGIICNEEERAALIEELLDTAVRQGKVWKHTVQVQRPQTTAAATGASPAGLPPSATATCMPSFIAKPKSASPELRRLESMMEARRRGNASHLLTISSSEITVDSGVPEAPGSWLPAGASRDAAGAAALHVLEVHTSAAVLDSSLSTICSVGAEGEHSEGLRAQGPSADGAAGEAAGPQANGDPSGTGGSLRGQRTTGLLGGQLGGLEEGAEGNPQEDEGLLSGGLTPLLEEALAPQYGECWHEIIAKVVTHAPTKSRLLLVLQRDVTERAVMEKTLSELMQAQLDMLAQIFPRHIIEQLAVANTQTMDKETIGGLGRSHPHVSILFMDIVGFTSMSKAVQPQAVMSFLNQLFGIFDALCDLHKVHKVETAGDCYIVSGGILTTDEEGFLAIDEHPDEHESARRVMAFAADMLRCSKLVKMPHNGEPVVVRVGIHSGSCTSGLIGTKLPKFAIFGDTMNTASRMESTCTPGRIQISEATHELLFAQLQREPLRGCGTPLPAAAGHLASATGFSGHLRTIPEASIHSSSNTADTNTVSLTATNNATFGNTATLLSTSNNTLGHTATLTLTTTGASNTTGPVAFLAQPTSGDAADHESGRDAEQSQARAGDASSSMQGDLAASVSAGKGLEGTKSAGERVSGRHPRVEGAFTWTGGVEVKGKGLMQTYLWVPPEGFFEGGQAAAEAALAAANTAKRHMQQGHRATYHGPTLLEGASQKTLDVGSTSRDTSAGTLGASSPAAPASAVTSSTPQHSGGIPAAFSGAHRRSSSSSISQAARLLMQPGALGAQVSMPGSAAESRAGGSTPQLPDTPSMPGSTSAASGAGVIIGPSGATSRAMPPGVDMAHAPADINVAFLTLMRASVLQNHHHHQLQQVASAAAASARHVPNGAPGGAVQAATPHVHHNAGYAWDRSQQLSSRLTVMSLRQATTGVAAMQGRRVTLHSGVLHAFQSVGSDAGGHAGNASVSRASNLVIGGASVVTNASASTSAAWQPADAGSYDPALGSFASHARANASTPNADACSTVNSDIGAAGLGTSGELPGQRAWKRGGMGMTSQLLHTLMPDGTRPSAAAAGSDASGISGALPRTGSLPRDSTVSSNTDGGAHSGAMMLFEPCSTASNIQRPMSTPRS